MAKKIKVLLIRFSSIGDIVLTTPIVRAIKRQRPEVELHYCSKKSYASIFEANPYIDKMHYLEEDLSQLAETLRTEQFDYVIDLHKNLRTLRLKLGLRAKSRSFNKLNLEKWVYVNFKKDWLPNVHIVDRYMEPASRLLNIVNDEEGLDYFIPYRDEVEIEWLPETHREAYIAFAIGGQHATKRLPLERMIELCDKINKPIVLLGGKEDAEIGQKIADFFENKSEAQALDMQKLNKKAIIYNACGKYNLNQSASLIRQSKAVFTHDTGLMHIAAAFKKQVFSIWGNTSPKFGMYPYQTQFVIFENNRLSCRPCSKIGYERCPKGHFKCMNDLVFDFYLP